MHAPSEKKKIIMKKGNHTVKLETGVSLFNTKTISKFSPLHMPELQKLIF